MLEAFEDQARALGITTLRLETNKTLQEAIALYRSAGYRQVAAFNDEPAPVSKPAQSKADVIKAANDLLGEAPKTKLADKK